MLRGGPGFFLLTFALSGTADVVPNSRTPGVFEATRAMEASCADPPPILRRSDQRQFGVRAALVGALVRAVEHRARPADVRDGHRGRLMPRASSGPRACESAMVSGKDTPWRGAVDEDERQLIASFSKSMASMCVRNTMLEDIHAGIEPVTRTGDYSDVMVIDADGRRIPWPEVSRIGNEEMGRLMREVVNRLYTYQVKADDPHFVVMMDRALAEAKGWDEPELDAAIVSGIERARRPAEAKR